jgi:aryl-alcohol dehydrogenase-like predicted oxidoreductase
VGLGTVKIGRNAQVKYPEPFDLPSDSEVEFLLESALELGVTLWDTAPAYGSSEERLAPLLRRHRDRVVLVTKAGESFDGQGSFHDFRSGALVASLESSLRRLGTDHVDLLLLHSDGRDREILEQTDALAGLLQCREEGKTRAIGLSAKTSAGIRLAARDLDAVMAPYGLLHEGLGEDLRDPLEAALRFVLEAGFVDSVVVGTRRPEHLRQIVDHARRILAGER